MIIDIDDPELQPAFEKMGITDPKDKRILLDYITELFSIAIEHVLKNENQHHD
jgi:hypothetical protein